MTLTVNSPFRSSPRVTEERFVAVLRERGALGSMPLWNGLGGRYADTEAAARALYRVIAERGHDPGVFLGICGKEHSFGTNRDSVLWRNDTRSWTNARTVRDPALTGWTIVRDAVRRSDYVRYADVFDSVRDGMYRVDDPSYAYRDARTIAEVIAIWAPGDDGNRPREYAQTIVDWLHAWGATDTETDEEPMMAAQIPGFAWQPADENHYTRGRIEKIRGGAQHYTAGTNSLAWLTTTSQPPVSATFLVRHDPTLEDRGWQLVRIEDTAWTTAFANPYTVSIEYEHDGRQPIPDMAYTVLAQTWIDIAAYVRANGLGEIAFDRTGIRGHREWVGNPGLTCPDGVDVERIVRRIRELQAPPPEPQTPADDGTRLMPTGKRLLGGFRGEWEGLEQTGQDRALRFVGYPLTDEFRATLDGQERTVQVFERTSYIWFPENDQPWHVVAAPDEVDAEIRRQAREQGLLPTVEEAA